MIKTQKLAKKGGAVDDMGNAKNAKRLKWPSLNRPSPVSFCWWG
jgi:hypothetical protein